MKIFLFISFLASADYRVTIKDPKGVMTNMGSAKTMDDANAWVSQHTTEFPKGMTVDIQDTTAELAAQKALADAKAAAQAKLKSFDPASVKTLGDSTAVLSDLVNATK